MTRLLINIALMTPCLLASCKKAGDGDLKVNEGGILPFHGLGVGATEFNYVMPINLSNPTRCIEVAADKIKYDGFRDAMIDQKIQKKYSYDWLEAGLEASMNIEARVVGISVASASVETRFRAANINTKVSYSSATDFKLRAGTAHIDTYRFVPGSRAESLAQQLNDIDVQLPKMNQAEKNAALQKKRDLSREFFVLCGDRFVHQSVLGASFSSAARVHYTDNRKLLDFMVKAQAKIFKVKKTQRENEFYDTHLMDTVYEVETFQEGGDRAKYESFKTSLGGNKPDSNGSKRVRCFTEPFDFTNTEDFERLVSKQLEMCFDSFVKINQYLKSSFYDQIALGNKESLKTIDQHALSYFNAGLLLTPMVLTDDDLKQVRQLEELFRKLAKLDMLLNHIDISAERATAATVVSDEWKVSSRDFLALKDDMQTKVNMVKERIANCAKNLFRPASGAACSSIPLDMSAYKNYLLNVGDL